MATRIQLILLSVLLASSVAFFAGGCLALYGRLRRSREECRKLRLQRINLRRELDACMRRQIEIAAAGDAPIRAKAEAFVRLRKLAIRALHPDNAPDDSPAEKSLRSEMFKAFWPELVKIEADLGPPRSPAAGQTAQGEPTPPPQRYAGPERRRQDVPINWRDRRARRSYSVDPAK